MTRTFSVAAVAEHLLNKLARSTGLPSCSAAVQYASRLLRLPGLENDYATAWQDWEASGDGNDWATTSNDGLSEAPQ